MEMIHINTGIMFSTGNNNQATPWSFFNRLNSVFNFTLDVCADETNHKCALYFSERDNALIKDWGGHVVFCNPPYSKKTKDKIGQEDFIRKCVTEWKENDITCVMLIPARTDTATHHELIFPNAKYICFIKGRLKFSDSKSAAPFPSELVVFTDEDFDSRIEMLSDLGRWIKLRK